MESFYQGKKGSPAKNPMGIPSFGTSCLHCHYTATQYDFSWMLANQPYPSTAAPTGELPKRRSGSKDGSEKSRG